MRSLGAQAFSYTVDCSSSKAVSDTAERVLEEVGAIYMLINNAGVLVGEDILSLSERNITQTMNINALAHFWVSTHEHLLYMCTPWWREAGKSNVTHSRAQEIHQLDSNP